MSRRAPASTIVISAFGLRREVGDRRALGQLERLVGLAERAVAVGHDREVGRGAVHPLGGAQLGQRLGVVARGVRRLAGGLAHHGQPRRARPRGQGVLVGGLGVLVDEQPGGGQVPGDAGGQLLGQPLELGGDGPVELGAGDLLGQVAGRRTRLVRGARRLLVGGPLPVVLARAARAGRAVALAAACRDVDACPRRAAPSPAAASAAPGRRGPPPRPAPRVLPPSTGGTLAATFVGHADHLSTCSWRVPESLLAVEIAVEATLRWPLWECMSGGVLLSHNLSVQYHRR